MANLTTSNRLRLFHQIIAEFCIKIKSPKSHVCKID